MTTYETEPAHLAAAGDALEAILTNTDLDAEAHGAVGMALAVLCDVHPPYAPRPAPIEPLALRAGVALALAELRAAIAAATSVREATRAGFAARELLVLRERW